MRAFFFPKTRHNFFLSAYLVLLATVNLVTGIYFLVAFQTVRTIFPILPPVAIILYGILCLANVCICNYDLEMEKMGESMEYAAFRDRCLYRKCYHDRFVYKPDGIFRIGNPDFHDLAGMEKNDVRNYCLLQKIKRVKKKKDWWRCLLSWRAVFITSFKLAIGLLTHSLGILAEAAHSALDLVAAAVTLFAVRGLGPPGG